MHTAQQPRRGRGDASRVCPRAARRLLATLATSFVVTLVALPGAPAAAQESDVRVDGPREMSPPVEAFTASVFGRLGFGQLDEDYFLTVAPGTVLRFDRFGIGVHVPLRFRVVDQAPLQDGVLRDEDWDEASDFTRILRFAEYGRRGDPFYARLGELVGVTLGHGTVVDRYYNTVDIDHYQTGLEVHVDAWHGGGQVMLDNLIDPNILALRGFVRPLAFLDVPAIFQRFVFGVTYASDYQAPSRIRANADGTARVTGDVELAVDTEVVTVYGFDLGWEVLRHEVVDITPYFDVNFLDRMGAGVHLGVLTNFRLPSDTFLFTRLEYRYLTNQYSAAYFNSLYEIERFRFRGGVPKLGYLLDGGEGSERHGFYGELTLLLFRLVTVTVTYEDYDGPNNSSLTALLRLPWLGPVLVQAFYAKRNFGGAEQIFDLDGALLVTEARVRILDFLYVFGEYAREWHLVDVDGNARYETVNDWSVGVGASFDF